MITKRKFLTVTLWFIALVLLLKELPALRFSYSFLSNSEFGYSLIYCIFLLSILIFSPKISKILIGKDAALPGKKMFMRFLISLGIGVVIFIYFYVATYSQRAEYFAKTHYPPAILTIGAAIYGIIAAGTIFFFWYAILYAIASIKRLLNKGKQPANSQPYQ